jgi:hypothetical protein
MSLMLITEGFKVMTSWGMIYPFGAQLLPAVEYGRVVWYFFSILSLLLYFSVCSFYPVRFLGFMTKDIIRKNLFWGLPLIASLIVGALLYSSGGVVETFGGLVHVACFEPNSLAEVTLFPGTEPLGDVKCVQQEGYFPFQYFLPQQTPLARLLLLAPIFFAKRIAYLEEWYNAENESVNE